jgi:8-oxo-dGTP pyrophosphatase MutT (NUDIX family)
LITQRNPNRARAQKWEITGGSILKGETPEHGAIRELKEETGIELLTFYLTDFHTELKCSKTVDNCISS